MSCGTAFERGEEGKIACIFHFGCVCVCAFFFRKKVVPVLLGVTPGGARAPGVQKYREMWAWEGREREGKRVAARVCEIWMRNGKKGGPG